MDQDLIKKALQYNQNPTPGQITMQISKKLNLHLGYTPGIAAPCLEIQKDIQNLYKYTSVYNSVAVVSNGTAVLGLGNLGAACAMPVMEGKCVLLKYYANINGIPIVLDSTKKDELINIIKSLQYSFGGINLEDIKAPECFDIENSLIDTLNMPVFHDDQHGTAIIVSAFIINALELIEKDIKHVKIVINGAGAAGIACAELLQSLGANNIILCDTKGAIFENRGDFMHASKQKFARKKAEILKEYNEYISINENEDDTQESKLELNNTVINQDNNFISLTKTIVSADIFIGVSVKNILTKEMLMSMKENPLVLALANPEPEILPGYAKSIRRDVIIATGRPDFNNQVNNSLCFPYIFRSALDLRVNKINTEMKKASVYAICKIQTPNRDAVIPKLQSPFDPETFECINPLLKNIVYNVSKAAIATQVNKVKIESLEEYIEKVIKNQTILYKNMHLNGLI